MKDEFKIESQLEESMSAIGWKIAKDNKLRDKYLIEKSIHKERCDICRRVIVQGQKFLKMGITNKIMGKKFYNTLCFRCLLYYGKIIKEDIPLFIQLEKMSEQERVEKLKVALFLNENKKGESEDDE